MSSWRPVQYTTSHLLAQQFPHARDAGLERNERFFDTLGLQPRHSGIAVGLPETVNVHDLVYRKDDDGWQLLTSAYRKLRLSADWVAGTLETTGLAVNYDLAANGEITLIATKR